MAASKPNRLAISVGEIAYGLVIGYVSLRVRRWVSDPRVEIILSLLTPFAAYWPPESVGGSGVLATVVCGLYISWNGPLLIPSHTRLQGIFFWDLFIFLLEGALFLLTGMMCVASAVAAIVQVMRIDPTTVLAR